MRFCGQCGNSIPDDAYACPYCGAVQGGRPAPAKTKKPFGETLKGFVQKNKTLAIAAAGVAAAVILLVLALAIFGSSYKTPIQDDIKKSNASSLDVEENFINMYGGLGKSHLKKIYKIIASSDNFEALEDSLKDDYADAREDLQDDYGKNVKFSVKIEDTDPMTNSRLKTLRDAYLKDCGKQLMEEGDRIIDMSSDDLADLADEMGIKKDDLRKLGKELKELGKQLKNTELKKGYDVDTVVTVKGSEDKDSEDTTYVVAKAGSKWILPYSVSQYTLLGYLRGIGYQYY